MKASRRKHKRKREAKGLFFLSLYTCGRACVEILHTETESSASTCMSNDWPNQPRTSCRVRGRQDTPRTRLWPNHFNGVKSASHLCTCLRCFDCYGNALHSKKGIWVTDALFFSCVTLKFCTTRSLSDRLLVAHFCFCGA